MLRDDAGEVIGAVVLDSAQPPEYGPLRWQITDPAPMVIHRLCVTPELQKRGGARRLMDFAEQMADERGHLSIRLDTYLGNPRAMAMYVKRGYRVAGYLRFPGRKLGFVGFEKPARYLRNSS